MEFRRWANQIPGDDQLHRLQSHESRRIVEDRADVLGRCGAAGVRVPESARILFLQRKSRALRWLRRKGNQRSTQCRRKRREPKRFLDHPNVLLWFFDRLASRRPSESCRFTIHREFAIPVEGAARVARLRRLCGRDDTQSAPSFDAVRQGGGNSRGLRSGPTATYVRLASVTFTVISLPGLRCAYTSTATVIDVRPTFVISAKNDTTSPTKTGCLKMNELTATVATRPQARWEAGMAPATSTCDMIQPPKISPWKLASAGIGTTRSTGAFDGIATLSSIASLAYAACAAALRASSRNSRRSILPTFDFGHSLRNSTSRGHLYAVKCSRQCWSTASAVSAGSFLTT